MIEAGDVVTALLPGVSETKRRSALVISTAAYHRARPDVLLALVTTQVEKADSAFDAVLFDWQEAGLQFPSAMRSFLFSKPARELNRIGRLSDADWQVVQERLKRSRCLKECQQNILCKEELKRSFGSSSYRNISSCACFSFGLLLWCLPPFLLLSGPIVPGYAGRL